MKVEIWSDIMCPFCYIGKRRFEQGLAAFEGRNDIEIIWRSYQLMPDLDNVPKLDAHATLAQKKGISYEQAKEMNQYVTEMAAEVGLSYHMDKAQLANSYDAHRFAHFAAQQGMGDQAEEKLFLAYFTEGKNIADHETLVQLGTELGLDAQKTREVLSGDAFTDEVERDIRKAYENGVRGVPFFV